MIDGKVLKTKPSTNIAKVSSLSTSLDSISHNDVIEMYKRKIKAEKNLLKKVHMIKKLHAYIDNPQSSDIFF
jgi:hypothetical protein